MHRSLSLLLLLSCLSSCGSSGTQATPSQLARAGAVALAAKDHGEATARFTELLEAINEEDTLYRQAQVGLARADAHVAPARAAHRFTTYASGPGADLELATLVGVADAFLSAQATDEAMEIFKLADRLHPGAAGLATLAKRIEKAAADDGSGGLSDDLKSLGYLGEG